MRDVDGEAGDNPITIDGNGATIDGAASLVMDQPFADCVLRFDAGANTWRRLVPLRVYEDTECPPESRWIDLPGVERWHAQAATVRAFFDASEAEDAGALALLYAVDGTATLLDEPQAGNAPLILTGRVDIEAANAAFFGFVANLSQRVLSILSTDVAGVKSLSVNTILEFDADFGDGTGHFTGWENWTFAFDASGKITSSVAVVFGDLVVPDP